MTRESHCTNFNHKRANAPVRFCPMCGEVVNESIPNKACSEDKHAISRRKGNKYCIDCGKLLINSR